LFDSDTCLWETRHVRPDFYLFFFNFHITIEELHKDIDLPEGKKEPISSKLRESRLQAGLTQKQLAEETDTTAGYISYLENNLFANPNHEISQRIANALGKPVNELWDNSWERKDLTEKQQVLIRAYNQFQKEDRLKLLEELKEFEEEKRTSDR